MVINPNKISIDFKDTPYAKGAGVSVQDARDGDISQLGIEYTKDCAVQKEMDQNMIYTGTNQKEITDEVRNNLPEDSFDPADFINQSINGRDARDIEEEGSMLEEYVDSTLERVIEKVKTERKANEEALDKQVEKEKEKREFSQQLEEQIQLASQLAAKIPQASDAALKYFIEQEGDVTPAAIGNSMAVQGSGMPLPSPDRASYEEMEPQIQRILQENHLEEEADAKEAAKWLYEADIPVTGTNIEKYRNWQDVKNLSEETINQRIEDAVREGSVPREASLEKMSYDEAAEEWEQINQVTEEQLREFYPEEAEFIRAKRQLEEIRLKMTAEAAGKMERNGIHVDIRNLSQIVEELKQMEKEACQSVLQEQGIELSDSQRDVMVDAVNARNQVWQAPVAVLGQTIGEADSITLQNMAEVSKETAMAMGEELSKHYEAVGTQVRRDLGDSIQKAFQNVDEMLEDMGLEKTMANQRAVRILAYNQMEVTKESVLSMKDYDAKVTSVLERMKPAVVAKMVANRENPLEMTMDELNKAIETIGEELSEEDISFRKYLWKLDHRGDISPEERKSMIGIYRLMDKVEKSDGAVIGQLVKEGRELSFSSLLSAVRTRRAEGKEFQIDDEFGALEKVESTSESISDQIGAAFGNQVIHKLKKELSPGILKDPEMMEKSCESIWDACETREECQAETEAYYEALAENIREMAGLSDERIQQCLQAADIPATLQNIREMKKFLGQERAGQDELYSVEESESLLDLLDQPEAFEKKLEELDEVHEQKLEEEKQSDEITYDTLQDLIQMAGSISFYRQMRRSQTFSVPIVTEHGVTSCSFTVMQGSKEDKGTVEISMNSRHYGKLQASFKVAGDRVSGFVTGEETDASQKIAELVQEIEKDLEMNGFAMERMDVAKGTRHSFHVGDKKETTNRKLYQVAKIVVRNVQRKEAEI